MNNQEAINRLIGLTMKMSYKIRIEEEDIEALEKGSEALKELLEISKAFVYVCEKENYFGVENAYRQAKKILEENK